MPRRDDWLDEDEYPSEKDMDDLGDDSPFDHDRLSIGRVRGVNDSFWTCERIGLGLGALILLIAFVLSLLNR